MKRILMDIGANRGLYTKANINKFDVFILVEANPALAKQLENNYNANSNFHVVNAIFSNKEKETFYISNADTISTVDIEWIHNSRFANKYSWNPIENISTISLDKLISLYGEPSLLKIDVEGYEYNVLLSLTKKVPLLSFEFAEEKKKELLLSLEYLLTLGFTKFYIQYEDQYTFEVKDTEWKEYSKIMDTIDSTFIVDRKSIWGMIWAC